MKKNPRHSDSHSGFTMVELLVVIVIIAVLAAISITVSSKMKARGESMKVIANMRQVGSLLMGFAVDNSSKLPAPKGTVVDASGNATEGLYWHQAIVSQMYADLDPARLKDNKWWEQTNPILHNPKCTKLSKPYPVAHWNQGYAMNWRIAKNLGKDSGDWTPGSGGAAEYGVPLGSVSDVARIPIIAPRANFHYSGSDLSEPGMKDFLIDGKVPILFVDGHVETIFPKDYMARKLDDLPRK